MLKIIYLKKIEFKGNTFYKAINNFTVLPYSQNVLLTFIVGKDSIFVENLEEECLVDVLSEILAKCFTDLNLPRPKRVIT